ncbi:MAG: UDP-N-acetylmuramoyl-L-alanyl-D-glutamate--2,6-diaminopimelate ligase [Nitrospirae bacterium]|nr:UDP-N-acetylmuramoyl-L-alanyl-D-glutamate--2,6-diaminopimelate ligase [Nitrospirota bacterium]
MKISDILRDDYIVKGDGNTSVLGVCCDSRQIKKGDLFIAVRGGSLDGHAFIGDAIKRGAAAIVYEIDESPISNLQSAYPGVVWIGARDCRDAAASISSWFYKRPSEELNIIGITGTNGKTTTSYIIKAILEKYGRDVGLIGTINYCVKDETFPALHTTPEAPNFQSLLRKMSDSGCGHIVAEVSSHSLSQKRVDYTVFKTAVFTNLTRDHLDFHGTMEAYFSAKKRLFTELLDDEGAAIINIDDHYGERLVDAIKGGETKNKGIKILSYAIKNKDADILAYDIKMSFKGMSFNLRTKDSALNRLNLTSVETPLVGIPNVYNILSAVSATLSMGIPVDVIQEGIKAMPSVKGRFEKIDIGQDFLAVVDYAHTEDALERLLLTARQLLLFGHRLSVSEHRTPKTEHRNYEKSGKIITVFGCGGNRDRGKRPVMGEIASRMSGFVILTSDNPRDEDPRDIIREIEKGIKGDNYIVIPNRDAAIRAGVELASRGDILLVAGKGHEDYQEIKGVRSGFSDSAVLTSAIRMMKNRVKPVASFAHQDVRAVC